MNKINTNIGEKAFSNESTNEIEGIRSLAELVGLVTRLTACETLEDLLNTFGRGLSDIWPSAGIRLCHVDHMSGTLIPSLAGSVVPIPIMSSFLGRAVSEPSPVISENLDNEAKYLRGREAPPGLLWRKAIAVLIPIDDKPEFVIGVYLPDGDEINNGDLLAMHRAIELLQQLINRWQVQDLRLNAFREITASMAYAIDARDPYLIGHSERVSEFSRASAMIQGLSVMFIDRLGIAGLLHDVGRLGIPESILLKTEKLTPEEYKLVKSHPDLSIQFLGRVEYLRDLLPVIRHHHECFDGSGYPEGLEGDDIPLGARIIAVADAFDAMTSPRPFRGPMKDSAALAELKKKAGSQFDPIVVQSFTRAYDEKLIISQNVLEAHDPLALLRPF